MKSTFKLFFCLLCLVNASITVAAKEGEKDKDAPAINVKLRPVARTIVLAPGESGNVASICLAGEVVVGGGPTNLPAQVKVLYSTLFFDGVSSGWQIELKNNVAETITIAPEVGALCIKGSMTLG